MSDSSISNLFKDEDKFKSEKPKREVPFPFLGVLKRILSTMWQRKGLLAILCGLSFLLTLFVFLPFYGVYWNLFHDLMALQGGILEPDPSLAQKYEESLLTGWRVFPLWLIVIGFFASMISAVWTRSAVLDKAQVFEGGANALVKRAARILWRTICLIGWLFVLMIGLVIIGLILALTINAGALQFQVGVNPYASLPWQLYVLNLIAIIPISIVMFCWGVSIHGEARDFRLPIHASLGRLGGHIWKALGLGLVLFLLFEGWMYVLQVTYFFDQFESMMPTSQGETINIQDIFTPEILIISGVFSVFYFVASFLAQFSMIALGAIYADKLVPELNDPRLGKGSGISVDT